MIMKKIIAPLLGLLLSASAAFGQATVPAGGVMGNSTAAERTARAETVTAILDRALGSTRGAIIERGASGWAVVVPSATVGLAWVSGGTGADPSYGIVALAGGGCGAALTASNGGVLYSTATACAILAGTATARLPLLSGSTAAPVWGAYTLPASVTSGGVQCFTSTTVAASSVLLSANAIVLGGGAGVCPSPMGSLGTTTTVLHGNAAGPPTFGAVVSADLNITATNCTNQFVSAISTGGIGTCSSVGIGVVTGLGTGVGAALAIGISNVGGFITTDYNAAARGGSFDVWQRLTNGATTIAQAASTTAYVNDSWYLITNANQAATVTRAAGIAVGSGGSTVNGSVYAATVQRNNGQTGTGVIRYAMPLDTDELTPLWNSNVALSFTIKSGANQSFSNTVNALVYCGTGSPGKRGAVAYTSETTVISFAVTTSSTPSRQQATSSSVVPSTCTQMEIQFNITPSGTAGADDSFTVDDLQLEAVGSSSAVATPFMKKPFQQYLAMSQRFLMVYNRNGGVLHNAAFGNAISTTRMYAIFHLHVPMRIAPTGITVSAAGDFRATDGAGTGIAATNVAFVNASTDTFALLADVAAGFTVGQGSAFQFNLAAAQIILTGAEL